MSWSNTASTVWGALHEKVLSALSFPIPHTFRVVEGDANRATGSLPPSKFDLHLPPSKWLCDVKWAPSLVEQGMENLRSFHMEQSPARDPGNNFWSRNDIRSNLIMFSESTVVTGEAQVQTHTESKILRPLCHIASRILFHLNAYPPNQDNAFRHGDLIVQTSDRGPPLWDTVIKLPLQVIPILIENIIYALELKSLAVASSSFFFQLCSRYAAASVKLFPYQR